MTAPTFCRTQLNNRGNDFSFHNGPTEKVDCNIAQASMCLQVDQSLQLSAAEIRSTTEFPSGPTDTTMADRLFRHHGMERGTDYVRFHRVDVQRVRDMLAAGWYVVLYVKYGVINDNLGGKFSGAKTYRGNHAIGLAGWVRISGVRTVWDYDSTFDGRKPGYPKGRQRVPFWLLREAAYRYSRDYVVSGYAVRGW